jgi:hypothetical protein
VPITLLSLHSDDCATHPGIRPFGATFTPASAACRLLDYGLENDRRGTAIPAIRLGCDLELFGQEPEIHAARSSRVKELLP